MCISIFDLRRGGRATLAHLQLTAGMYSAMAAKTLMLDFNAFKLADQYFQDVLGPADACAKKDSIAAMQAVLCSYAITSVRESSTNFPQAARSAEALPSLQEVAIPSWITLLKETGFIVPDGATKY